MKLDWKIGLRGRLILMLLVMFIAVSGLLVWHSSVQCDKLLQEASGNLLNRAMFLAARYQALAERGDAVLGGLMQDSLADGCEGKLAERLGREPSFSQLGRIVPGDAPACTAHPEDIEGSVADRPWFQQALRLRGMIVSEVISGHVPDQQFTVLAKAMEGESSNIRSVSYLYLSLDRLRRMLAENGLPEGATLALTDNTGEVVARHPDQDDRTHRSAADQGLIRHVQAEGRAGTTIAGTDGDAMLVAYAPFLRSATGQHYFVLLSLPVAQAEAPARRELAWSLAIAFIVLVATLATVSWGGRRYVEQPLGILSLIAHEFGAGDFDARRRLPRSSGEIGELSLALKEMAAKLQKSTVSRRRLQVEIDNHKLAKERLKLALESANAACFEWNIESGESVWSEKMWTLLGINPDDSPASYEAWRQSVHPEDLEQLEISIREALSRGGEFEVEWRARSAPPDAPRWLMGRGRPLREEDGRISKYFGVMLDISERKLSEQALKVYRNHLEELVAERTAQLMTTNKDLEGFTYAASHDMKGPLGRINSFCSLLSQRYRSRLEGNGIDFLDLIQQNAQRLNILVDDLLAHAQVSQHPLHLQAVDVSAIAHAVVEERTQDIHDGHCRVLVDLPDHLMVRGTPIGIGQVLRNLLENAIKYSAHSDAPLIEIGGQTEGGTCRIWIRDNGIGIDESYHEKIFEIFRRLHTYNEYPGNGIGLALVKKAMERMGGRVWVESRPGQGATFFLEFELASEEADFPPATALTTGADEQGEGV
jgi:signal transduction histidine kinase/HAMP domain-containing protein